MGKAKIKELSTQKQIDIVRDKLLDVMEDVQNEVSVPNFIFGALYTITELTYDTAPNPIQAQLLINQAIMAHLEHREDIDKDPYITKLKKGKK